MLQIRAQEKSIRELLGGKYQVDSYQREYKWETKQIDDLVDDLVSAFDECYEDSHELIDVKKYSQYFLGPIIVNDKNYIVDGQQRLTTLTLALICLLHRPKNESQQAQLRNLIYSESFGVESFNIDVPERAACLHHFLRGTEKEVKVDGEPESVRNLVLRYKHMKERLTESLTEEKIPLFTTWLIEKVLLIEIAASSGKDAYKIFETMNDRGLHLTPAEMLKGYLLSEIRDDRLRAEANAAWKKLVDVLSDRKNEDADAIKSWLRARHAKKASDFEDIGAQFHRWVRDNADAVKLKDSRDFAGFITRDFDFYARAYMRVRHAAENYGAEPSLERIRYLAQHSFTLQYPLLLAPLLPGDPAENTRKLRVIAAYLDILVHRRIGNRKTIAESTMRSQIFGLIPEIRAMNAQEIASHLVERLEEKEQGPTFAADFGLHQTNRPRIHRILARITHYVETQSARPSQFSAFFATGEESFDIEHIWHADYKEVCGEEDMLENDLHKDEFDRMRNYIGGLLLLLSKDNKYYSNKRYAEKRDYYRDANRLAASLHEDSYHAGFGQFNDRSSLPFEPHVQFQKADLEKRQSLYRAIADKIWHPDIIHEEARAN